MTSAAFEALSARWQSYVDGFRVAGALHPMQQLKLDHSLRVAADARAIAAASNWADEQVALAEAIGLLHDTARFPQFERYESFSDAETIDHGELGFETLIAEELLVGLSESAQSIILHAVRHHNKKELPPGLRACEERHLRLIRDADRIDIFFVCWQMLRSKQWQRHPALMMNVDWAGLPSESVLDQFERGEAIAYQQIQTMADRFVLQLSWMHDLSYNASKRLVREREILAKFKAVLPVQTDRLLRCFDRTEALLADA